MKKLLLLVAVAASFTFASCKKNYTCTCTYTSGGVSYGSGSVTIHDTKKKATTACSALQTSGETCSIN